ncbi:hypothetical protein DEU56DRAFT_795751, partial [Suillus clintonianus]|uniref:uncharacterized protein n=1 Tax=Suillus clintonianus TaxID=1904413 RepID=UPI001B85BA24
MYLDSHLERLQCSVVAVCTLLGSESAPTPDQSTRGLIFPIKLLQSQESPCIYASPVFRRRTGTVETVMSPQSATPAPMRFERWAEEGDVPVRLSGPRRLSVVLERPRITSSSRRTQFEPLIFPKISRCRPQSVHCCHFPLGVIWGRKAVCLT